MGWSGQSFVCVVSNMAGSVTSTPAILTVRADTNPPTILNVVNLGLTNVQITYSKTVEAASATNAANYVFTNGLAVTCAALNPDNQTVVLTTAPMTYGSNYCIVINRIRDLASTPNTMATIDFSNPSRFRNDTIPITKLKTANFIFALFMSDLRYIYFLALAVDERTARAGLMRTYFLA